MLAGIIDSDFSREALRTKLVRCSTVNETISRTLRDRKNCQRLVFKCIRRNKEVNIGCTTIEHNKQEVKMLSITKSL